MAGEVVVTLMVPEEYIEELEFDGAWVPVFGVLNIGQLYKTDQGLVPMVRFRLLPLSDVFLSWLRGYYPDLSEETKPYVDLCEVMKNQICPYLLLEDGGMPPLRLSLSEVARLQLRNRVDSISFKYWHCDIATFFEKAYLNAVEVYGKKDDVKIFCNRCGFCFTPQLRAEWQDDLQGVVFECPTCNLVYVCGVSDEKLREQLRQMKTLEDKKEKLTSEEKELLLKMKQENTERSHELRKDFIAKAKAKGERIDDGKEEEPTITGNE